MTQKINSKNKIVYIVLFSVLLIVIDQVLKYGAIYLESQNQFSEVEIATSGMNLRYYLLFSFLLIVFIISFVKNQIDKIDKTVCTALSLIITGVVGNLIDKIVKGGVINIIKIPLLPTSNLASICMLMGWIIFIISLVSYNSLSNLELKRIIEKQDEELETGKSSKIKAKKK